MATIRRVPSIDHNFQLVVTRVYEDGDQELLEDEDESAPSAYPSATILLTSRSNSGRGARISYRRGAGIQNWPNRGRTHVRVA